MKRCAPGDFAWVAAERKVADVVNPRWKLRAATSIAPEIRMVQGSALISLLQVQENPKPTLREQKALTHQLG